MFDTYAFRFSKHADPTARKVIFILKSDFKTPHECFLEGDLAHWNRSDWVELTWGKMAGPFDLCLSPGEYAYYAELAAECREKTMALILQDRADNLLKFQLDRG